MKIKKESIFLIFYFFLFLVPFISFGWNYDGYEFPKYLFVILFGAIFSFIILLSEKIFIPNKIFSLFLIIYLISSIFSSNQLYSFFGDYPRLNQNFFLIFSILMISVVYRTYLNNFDIFKIIFYQSIFLSLVTLFEKNERVFATFGQPNFLGIILVLGIIYSINQTFTNKKYAVATLFLIFFLIKTASITSIISLIIVFFYFIYERERKYLKYFLPLVFVIFIFIFQVPITKEKLIDNINLLTHRETKITDSILVRYYIWEDSVKIISDNYKNFLIGIGPENFSLYYENFRGVQINKTSEWNSLIDKPHNHFLEVFIEIGILGFLIYLYLFYLLFKSNSMNKQYLIPIVVYLLFNWPHIYLQIILFIIFSKELFTQTRNNYYIKSVTTLFIISMPLCLIFFQFEEISKSKDFLNSRNPYVKLKGIDYFEESIHLDSYLNRLKEEYPNNLKIRFEIYRAEKRNNLETSSESKQKIRELRPDLLDWNEAFK